MDSVLTAIDGGIIILVILSAILAMAQGMTREILSIASVSIAAVVASHLAEPCSPAIEWFFDVTPITNQVPLSKETISSVIAGGICFVLIWLLLAILTHRLSEMVENSAIGAVDRGLGLVFGALRGLFIAGFIFILFTYVSSRSRYPEMLAQARLLPVLEETAWALSSIGEVLLPKDMSKNLNIHLKDHFAGKATAVLSSPRDKINSDDKKDVNSTIIENIIQATTPTKHNKEVAKLPQGVKKEDLPKMDTKTLESILQTLENMPKQQGEKGNIPTREKESQTRL